MTYKILTGTPLFDGLMAVFVKGMAAKKAADDAIAEQFDPMPKYAPDPNAAWGGIAAIQFDHCPEGWKVVDKWQRLYAPKASEKKIWAQWNALPRVKETEMKELLNYKNYGGMSGGGLVFSTLPELAFGNGYIAVKVEPFVIQQGYKPVDGMIEIMNSEHMELVGIIQKEHGGN